MSDTNRGTKRQAPTESSNHSEANDNLSQDDGLSLPGTSVFDETFSQVSRGKRKRKRFNVARRKEVATVRKIGACKDCRVRKVACKHALQGTDNPDSAPTPKPSPQPYPFAFEADYSNPTYPKTILDDGVGQIPQLDRSQLPDLSVDEGSELFASVKGYTGRRARLIDELHDFSNIIEDNSGHSRIKSQPDPSEWSQNSHWMESAMPFTNKQRTSQPSTGYLYSNFSTEPRLSSSTPTSSHTDLLSHGINNMACFQCNIYPCDHTHRMEQELYGRQHESEHAESYSSIKTYPCPLDCGMNPFRKLENLHSHINNKHPNISPTQSQLLPSSVSQLNTPPDSMAHVQKFVADGYVPGIEENPIAVTDQGPSQMHDRLGSEIWGSQNVSSRAQNLRRSNSPLHSQLSLGMTGGTTNLFGLQYGNASSGLGNNFAAMGPHFLAQQAPYRSQGTVDEMNSFNAHYEKRHSRPPLTKSPTLSWTGHFPRDKGMPDQADVDRVSSNNEEVNLGAGMQNKTQGTLRAVDTTSLNTFPNLYRNWNSSATGFNQQNLISYDDSGYSQNDASSQHGNAGAGVAGPSWSGIDSSPTISQAGGVNSSCAFPNFQPDNQGTEFLPNNTPLLPGYIVSPDNSKNPMIILNNQTMLYGGQVMPFNFGVNSLDSDQTLSQRYSLPYLDHGTQSSSGASESLISPTDGANPFGNKLVDDWDTTSNFNHEFSNMDMNTNDETD